MFTSLVRRLMFPILLGLCLLSAQSIAAQATANQKPASQLKSSKIKPVVDVGVLAIRGNLAAEQRWQPTIDWLNQHIPDAQFVLHPLDLDGMLNAVKSQSMDFIVTNPGQAVRLGRQYELSWMATLTNRAPSHSNYAIGSALVVRADSPYQQLADIAGHPMAAVSERAFGGYLTLRYQVLELGFHPNDFFANVRFLGFPIDANLYQLRDGFVDAAVVPACLLETMTREGLLEANRYRVLNVDTNADFHCQVSTHLYPNWSFAKTDRASAPLAKQVTRALLAMPAESPAAIAAGASGWTSPVSLLSIDKLYQALDLHPLQEPWWKEAIRWLRFHQEWAWALFIVVVVLNAYHFWLEYRFSKSQQALEKTQLRLKEKSEQLEHAQRVAIVGELGSSLAHEINQPLAAIRNYSEGGLLRVAKQRPAEEITPVFEKIQAQVDRADAIINRLRNLIKKRSLEKQPCNIETLLDETLELMHYRLQKYEVAISRSSEGDVIAVEADRVGMQQVLVNVLSNAIDACLLYQEREASGSYQPKIALHTDYQPETLYIRVVDNGTGLEHGPPSEAFVSHKAHGLGLGLAICRDVMESHGGQISLMSVEPHGCIVSLSLPYWA
ncbi:PhnD/SsuA/transferrin family substrate-binding protein [Vibrio fluvialis]|uniref:sensor histidine kinase n=1 Tax=Vibrio fluvialis TaxID=676 RepID=UPI001C9C5B76|nr:PhnD/SsuA/transferrin family substrate-binding protein [Vibrio fluvialis]MBY7923361.1 PhnD/SsuA/transferrin family substrate-binding protein [Vibrio fluvialis]MBY7979071.1 PhnD/SsuA/transferrin family substrate-binding protein [Vibrio fluvialis]